MHHATGLGFFLPPPSLVRLSYKSCCPSQTLPGLFSADATVMELPLPRPQRLAAREETPRSQPSSFPHCLQIALCARTHSNSTAVTAKIKFTGNTNPKNWGAKRLELTLWGMQSECRTPQDRKATGKVFSSLPTPSYNSQDLKVPATETGSTFS